VNESLLSEHAGILTKKSAFWELEKDWREKAVGLLDKIVIVLQLHFGCALPRGQEPLNSMRQLIKVRNELVHYKLKGAMTKDQNPIPKFVQDLVERRIALSYDEKNPHGYVWPQLLACSEGIRWAHNTACRTAHAMTDLVPKDFAEQTDMRTLCDANFVEITDQEVKKHWKSMSDAERDARRPESPRQDGRDRLRAIKARHPRAYQRWSEEEHTQLRRLVGEGRSEKTIAAMMQRQPSAIRSRIFKLGLLDAPQGD